MKFEPGDLVKIVPYGINSRSTNKLCIYTIEADSRLMVIFEEEHGLYLGNTKSNFLGEVEARVFVGKTIVHVEPIHLEAIKENEKV
jgi:hypothetical protein